MMLWIFILFFAQAQTKAIGTCPGGIWIPFGSSLKIAAEFDKILMDSKKSTSDKIKALNEFKKNKGLPFLLTNNKNNKTTFADRMEQPGGDVILAFLKFMRSPAPTTMQLDSVYEFKNLNDQKEKQKWFTPLSYEKPEVFESVHLIYKTQLTTLCSQTFAMVDVAIKINTNGDYEVIEDKNLVETTQKDISCDKNKVFPGSTVKQCTEYIESKTKEKRYLVWQKVIGDEVSPEENK